MSAKLCPGGRESLQRPFQNLAETLRKKSAGREIVFLQNDGNFGDGLIRAGTLCFFEDYGFDYCELDMSRRADKLTAGLHSLRGALLKDRLLVYSGSGAWSSYTSLGRRNVRILSQLGGDIFVLPTTFEEPVVFDERHSAYYVRDKYESRDAIAAAPFCHDMAFYLALAGVDRVLPRRASAPKGVLYSFRTDNEGRSHGLEEVEGNRDLSSEGNHSSDISRFLSVLDDYETVVTDRLHVAIGAVLLGKEVSLLPGGYFKIAAVYKSSIDGIFEGVKLIADDEEIRETIGA